MKTEIYTQADVNYETRYGYDNNGNLTVTYKSETKPYDPLVTGSVSVIFLEEDTLGLMTFYRYDGFNRLTAVNTSQTDALYAYSYDGLRKSKTVNGVTTAHIWVGSQIVLDIHDESIIKYIRGINLIARDDGTDRDFYLFNAHGDVTALTDTTGVITKSYHYDAFGNETNPDATDDNPFRYCGEYFDKETGTIYLRARYYNPATSRMLSEDTHWNVGNMVYGDDPLKLNEYTMVPNILAIMQSGNLYVYCMSNPIMYVDPDGKKLAFPGQIHREVAENIVRNNRSHLLSRERWVRYPTTILNKEVSALGRVDLVDLKTGYIWEIKPDKWPKVAAIEQLKRYESGKFLNKIFSDTKMEIYMGDGTGYALSGSFKYSIYDVSYKYEGNGIITYTYQADRDRVAKEVLNTVVEGGLALLVILIEIARSKGVPVPIPSY